MKMREKAYIPVRKDKDGNYSSDVGLSEFSSSTKEDVERMIIKIRGEDYMPFIVIRDEHGKFLGLEYSNPD